MQRLFVLVSVASIWFGSTGSVTSWAYAQDGGAGAPVRFDPSAKLGQLGDPNGWLQWRRAGGQAKFPQLLGTKSIGNNEKKAIERAAEVYVNRMTDPQFRSNIPDIVDEVLSRLNTFGKGEAKEYMLETLSKKLPNLFRHEDRVIRVNAAVFLGRLDSVSAGLGGGVVAVPYWPVYGPLLDAIEDPNQTIDVKYQAANGLERVAASSALPRRERDDLILRMAKIIRRDADVKNWPADPRQRANYWVYPKQLVEVMGSVRAARTLTVQPVPVDVLSTIALDKNQHWWTRATAFRAISELPLDDDNTFDIGLLANIGAHLFYEAAEDYRKNPNASHWRWTFTFLYLSYRPLNADMAKQGFGWEAKASEAKFRQHAGTVSAAFDAILPLLAEFMEANPLAPAALSDKVMKTLKDYVDANPVDGKVHPRMKSVKLPAEPPTPAQ